MKKLLIISMIFLIVACKQESSPRNYAVFHGKITNPIKGTNLKIFNPITSETIILDVDAEGNFRDSLKLKGPAYFTAVYDNAFGLYLESDMDLQVELDSEHLQKSISFSGQGAVENDFLRYKDKITNDLLGNDMDSYQNYLGMETNIFKTKTSAFIKELIDNIESKKELLSPSFIASEKTQIEEFQESLNVQHEEQLKIDTELSSGMPSPEFHDYLNFEEGSSSLSDFKGKYVYIDIWATWCAPCIFEMPFMAKVEKEYEGRNIHFIGLSIDSQKDENKWRKMIVDKELEGIQLLADNEFDSKFIQDYYIQGIPRFILLDPEGNVVNYNAPRPSEPKLKELFNSLEI